VPGPHLVVDRLARRFGPRWAVAGVSFALAPGRALMITGANGSGKSTLLRCLATALIPHQGTVQLDGRDLWTHRDALRARIGWLAHQLQLYEDLSPAENLRILGRLSTHRIDPDALLARVGLDPRRPDPVSALSAGMRRRAAIARLLAREPDLVLLDEPFTALDPDGRELLLEVLRDLRARGASLVLATHLPATASKVCDEAIHLELGRITWRGAASERAS
jgi:heme ABC exporter ATP-binding subunit CcmA